MKKLAYILTAVLALAACAKEEIHHLSEAEAPQTASAYEPVIVVDQEINQVTFSVNEKAVIPVWLFQDKDGEFTVRHAQNGYKQIFATAGDYKVRLQIMNAAGVTPDYVESSFHIDNTIFNFDKFETMLAGKQWRIEGETDGHFGCGAPGTDGTNWWKASAGDKESVGMYDNRMTFSAGDYTFDPGTAGTLYVNTGYTTDPWGAYNPGDGNDFTVPVDAKTSSYTFSVDGADLILELEAGAYFPYIPNPEFTAAPRFKVASSTAKQWVLIHDNGAIAWTFTITSSQGETKFNGFNYTAESNLWKPVDPEDAHTYSFYYAPGWSQLADPEVELTGGAYTLSFPSATFEQWQNQFFILPNDDKAVSLSADKEYDFSCILYSSKEIPNVTFKLTDTGSDGNFLFTERETIPAGQEYIFWRSGLAGIDADAVKMVFDFGGNPDDTEITISRITLKDHAIDDGTVLPNVEPEVEEGAHYDITGDTNFWRSMTYTMSFYTAQGSNWVVLPDSGFEADDASYVYNVSMPEATDNQWQRQVAFHTTMSSSADKAYDFCCTLTPTMDLPGVTFKLVLDGDDGTFYFEERHDLTAFEPFEFKKPNMPGIDMNAIALFFDFGGNPAGADVEIKDICFQEHQAPAGDEYNSDDNLWKPVDAVDGHTYSQYTATGSGWSVLPDPEITHDGSAYSFTYENATTDRWQAQFFIIPNTAIALEASKSYDFQCKVELSQAVPGVTFKLTDTSNDGNFLFDERRDIAAYEEFVFALNALDGIDADAVKMVFDFGGCPAGTEVTIKDIILREHK